MRNYNEIAKIALNAVERINEEFKGRIDSDILIPATKYSTIIKLEVRDVRTEAIQAVWDRNFDREVLDNSLVITFTNYGSETPHIIFLPKEICNVRELSLLPAIESMYYDYIDHRLHNMYIEALKHRMIDRAKELASLEVDVNNACTQRIRGYIDVINKYADITLSRMRQA